jgi:DNA-binding transcriptional MerR regulator
MGNYSVNQLAKLAGVSVRTLHHYDRIGLLKPGVRNAVNNYRLYGRDELLRLQQILFYKELGIPLAQIAAILDDPGFDMAEALRQHKLEIEKRRDRMDQLLHTIDNTIIHLKNNNTMNHEDMYKGFSKEQAEAYEKEALERWGDIARESQERLKKMSKDQWETIMEEMHVTNRELAAVMHLPVTNPQVQELVRKHYRFIGYSYTVTKEIYLGLAELYVTDERFTTFYDNTAPGLAAFLSKAMIVFSDTL